jgi:tight adherence protein B
MSLSPSVLMAAGVLSFGGATFTVAWSSGEELKAQLAGPWGRYRRWVADSVRALHLGVGERAFMLRHLALVAGGFLVGALLLGDRAKGLFFAAALAGAPFLWVKQARKKRKEQLEEQLESGLAIMANSVLATQNLVDGFEALVQLGRPPLSQECELLVKELRVGASMDDALHHLALRCQSRNVDSVVAALTIGRRTGGNLPKVLALISGVLRETMRVEGMMAAKTAEGKASGLLMAALPVLFGVVMNVIDPEWMAPLFNDPIGTVILGAVCVLEFVGALLINKISTIDA